MIPPPTPHSLSRMTLKTTCCENIHSLSLSACVLLVLSSSAFRASVCAFFFLFVFCHVCCCERTFEWCVSVCVWERECVSVCRSSVTNPGFNAALGSSITPNLLQAQDSPSPCCSKPFHPSSSTSRSCFKLFHLIPSCWITSCLSPSWS